MRVFLRLLVPLALLLVSACASRLTTDVARFHQLQRPSGERVMVVAKDPEKTGSLEFAQYAGVVASYMTELGYQMVTRDADLVVELDYVIGDGDEKVRTRNRGFVGAGGVGFNRGFYGFGAFGPGFGGGFYGPEIDSVTVYDRQVAMNIVRPVNNQTLFEGRVYSRGSDNRATEVVPFMIQALFHEFPGKSGTTERVVIELPS